MVGEDSGKHCHLRNRGKGTSKGNLQYIDTSFFFLSKSGQKQERVGYRKQREFQIWNAGEKNKKENEKICVLALAT